MLGMEAASDSAAGMERLPVDAAAYKELRKEVQKQVSAMVKNAKKEMRKRFPYPDILRAFSFIDLRYYCSEEASVPDLRSKLRCLAEHYSPTRPGISVDDEKLQEEAPRFFQIAAVLARNMLSASDDVEQDSAEGIAACDADISEAEDLVLTDALAEMSRLQRADHAAAKHPSVRMWRGIATLPAAEQLYGQIMKLAKIGMTLVGTSVSDERAFSAMTFVKNSLRSSLITHLPLCMRMKLQEEYDLSSFPYQLLSE
jgi:hypothetical protein